MNCSWIVHISRGMACQPDRRRSQQNDEWEENSLRHRKIKISKSMRAEKIGRQCQSEIEGAKCPPVQEILVHDLFINCSWIVHELPIKHLRPLDVPLFIGCCWSITIVFFAYGCHAPDLGYGTCSWTSRPGVRKIKNRTRSWIVHEMAAAAFVLFMNRSWILPAPFMNLVKSPATILRSRQ